MHKQVNVKFEWIEFIVVFMGIFFTILYLLSSPEIQTTTFIPNAVAGLSTIAGVLTTFIGFWLTYFYLHFTPTDKRWMYPRMKIIAVVVAFGLILVMIGLSQLVFSSLLNAFNVTLIGTFMIMMAVLEIILILINTEESNKEETKK